MNTPNTFPIRVIICDDHKLFREGVKSSLSSRKNIEVIAEAADGIELLEILSKSVPDIIILDIQMPRMDGVSVLPEIKRLYPSIKVIILTMHSDHTMISRMMEIGANSYLTKEVGSESIYEAIQAVYSEDFFFNDLTNRALLSNLKKKRTTENFMPLEVSLTEKEITILRMMCEEKSTSEIAAITDLSPRTVETIRDKLKEKTGTKSMAGLVMYAVKTGLVHQ